MTLTKQHASCSTVIGLFFLALVYIGLWLVSPAAGFLALLAGAVILFTLRLDWGVYMLAFLAFFQGLEIDLSRYAWARSISFLADINAPLVDFFAVLLFACFFFAFLLKLTKFPEEKKWAMRIPGFQWYGAFLLVALFAASGAYNHLFDVSFDYWLRPLVFVYIAYVLLPYSIISKQQTWNGIAHLLFGVGVAAALFGFSSLFVGNHVDWVRVSPYVIGGVAPLGLNHNLLAEVLVALVPIAGLLFFRASKGSILRWWYGGGWALMVVVGTLTLSRAAWLSFAAQGALLLWWYRHAVRAWIRKSGTAPTVLALAASIPVFLYMAVFLTSSTVSSSNISRAEMTRAAILYASERPLFGYGPGTFIYLLKDTTVFTLEFGDPPDSHGFVQKILVEEGLAGLVLFLGFLWWVVRLLWREQHTHHGQERILFQALMIMIVGGIVFQLFNTSYFNSVFWFPIGLSLAAVRVFTSSGMTRVIQRIVIKN